MQILPYFIILIFCAALPCFGADRQVDISRIVDGAGLGLFSDEYYGHLTIEEAMTEPADRFFTPSTKPTLSLSSGQEAIWQRLRLANSSSHAKSVYLWDETSSGDALNVYLDGKRIGGIAIKDPSHARVIRLVLPPKSSALVHVERRTRSTTVQSWSYWTNKKALDYAIVKSYALWGLIIATLFMTLLFNLISYYAYRRSMDLYYIGYILSYGSFATLHWGVFKGFSITIAITAGFLSQFFILQFAMKFIDSATLPRLASTVGKVMTTIVLAGTLVSTVDTTSGTFILSASALSNCLFITICGWYSYLKRPSNHQLVFNIGLGLFLAAICFQIAIWNGYLPLYSHHFMDIASAIENCLMLTAFGIRIWTTARENEHAYTQMQRLLYPHQIDYIMQGADLTATMPVGRSEATVVSFDVIGSSRITDPAFADCLEEFLTNCRALMMENYDQASLTSKAYMIKEMGDGFLCSIGFPFSCLQENSSAAATSLALQIRYLFRRSMSRLAGGSQINCSIGIASGEVKAYFSKSGSIRHDLWGKAVVLATRYESMRRVIFSQLELAEQDILIVQHDVYKVLPPAERHKFTQLLLDDQTFRVRDDAGATCLSYRLLNEDVSQTKNAS